MKPSLAAVKACLDRADNFYLYDEAILHRKAATLREAFPQIGFLYSIKCNPHPHVLRSVFACGFGADAASAGEVALARQAGLAANRIYYSAPGKTPADIAQTIGQAVLIADSLAEVHRIQQAAAERGITVPIGLRINPAFTFDGEGGAPSKFGIDEDQAREFLHRNGCKNVQVTGIHVHLKSQELDAKVLSAYYRRIFALAETFEDLCGGLDYINMGSGMGIPYTAADKPLDLDALSAAVKEELAKYQRKHPRAKVLIEVGRYVACESGVYVTTVLDRKVSHGKIYLILKNTLNGFLRPSLAQLIARYAPEGSPPGSEPLFTAKDAFAYLTLKEGQAAEETVTLVGNLCTAADIVAENIALPHLDCGDAIVITNAGSYGAVLSPMQFSTQPQPKAFFLTRTGELL